MIIEEIIVNWLNKKLEVKAFVEEPQKPPSSYVLVQKTNNILNNYINRSVITIQSYAESKYKSAVLNEKVKNAMFEVIEIQEITRCKLNNDYDYTDSETKRYRYQAVFDITYYQ